MKNIMEMLNISFNFSEIFSVKYLDGYFNRNKTIYLIALIIFVVTALIGVIFPIDYEYDNMDFDSKINSDNLLNEVEDSDYHYKDNIGEHYSNNDEVNMQKVKQDLQSQMNFNEFLNLFIHNFSIDFSVIICGIFLSIPSLFITFVNSVLVGSIFSTVEILVVLFGVLPHGIFEIPSSVISLAGAFMLTKIELNLFTAAMSKEKSVSDVSDECKYLFKDVIFSIILVFTFLFLAALIETFITPMLLMVIL